MNIRAGKFVHDALREGQRLRPKTWGKKSRCPRKARRDAKRPRRFGGHRCQNRQQADLAVQIAAWRGDLHGCLRRIQQGQQHCLRHPLKRLP